MADEIFAVPDFDGGAIFDAWCDAGVQPMCSREEDDGPVSRRFMVMAFSHIYGQTHKLLRANYENIGSAYDETGSLEVWEEMCKKEWGMFRAAFDKMYDFYRSKLDEKDSSDFHARYEELRENNIHFGFLMYMFC